MTTTKMKNLEQERAKTAYDAVVSVDTEKGKYKSNVKKLPMLIKANGLGQSLAFIQNREGWQHIYRQLTEWLQTQGMIRSDAKDLVAEVIKKGSDDYRQVTLECLAFLNWLRRFVDGVMHDVKEES